VEVKQGAAVPMGRTHERLGGEMTERDEAQSAADGDPAVVDAGAAPTAPPPVVAVVPAPVVPLVGSGPPAGAVGPVVAVAGPGVPVVDDETVGGDDGASRGGCRTERRGWAGAHLHGAVRPRRRAAGRGRPPGRWC
jgi:hypothetical protein